MSFPDVPIFPGVPPIPRDIGAAFSDVTALVSDLLNPNASQGPVWGIFDDSGSPAIDWDSIVGVEYSKEYRIATYPIEGGGFQSYNKVEIPYDARITLTKGGSEAERSAFLDRLNYLNSTLDLFSIALPEFTYANANVVRADYRRTAHNGVTLITAELIVEEVRVAPDASFTNSKSPSGADAVNDGQVQTRQPTPAELPTVEMT